VRHDAKNRRRRRRRRRRPRRASVAVVADDCRRRLVAKVALSRPSTPPTSPNRVPSTPHEHERTLSLARARGKRKQRENQKIAPPHRGPFFAQARALTQKSPLDASQRRGTTARRGPSVHVLNSSLPLGRVVVLPPKKGDLLSLPFPLFAPPPLRATKSPRSRSCGGATRSVAPPSICI
jgi:hypothetical protein